MDPTVESAALVLLDGILGHELASYWLYEARSMKGGGKIIHDGSGAERAGEWPIITLYDVRDYLSGRAAIEKEGE